MNKRYLGILLVFLMMFAVAACGEDSDDSSDENGDNGGGSSESAYSRELTETTSLSIQTLTPIHQVVFSIQHPAGWAQTGESPGRGFLAETYPLSTEGYSPDYYKINLTFSAVSSAFPNAESVMGDDLENVTQITIGDRTFWYGERNQTFNQITNYYFDIDDVGIGVASVETETGQRENWQPLTEAMLETLVIESFEPVEE